MEITPIARSSLSMGTESTVRAPASLRMANRCGSLVYALRPNVGNLDRLSRDRSLMQANTRTSANYWFSLPRLGECRRCSIQGNSAVCIAFRKKQYTELRLADACRVRQHSLKHRL